MTDVKGPDKPYAEPTFADDELWVQNAYLRIENRRMLEVIEQIHRTTGDMLEKERRRGPVADRLVHEMQKAKGANANAPEELDTNPERSGGGEGVGVRTMPQEKTGGEV